MARYKRISTASTNEEIVIASPAKLDGWYIVNEADVMRFVKIFDSATLPTLSSATPKLTLGIPANGAANVGLDSPLTFAAGITAAMVTGVAIGNTGAVGVNEIALNLYYE